MSEDLTPDPLEEVLGPRLRAVADTVDGTGVSRAAVAAAVDRHRRRQVRMRSVAVGAAAVIALLGGLAVATRSGDGGGQQVTSGSPTTTAADPCAASSADEDEVPAFWFRLSAAQAEFLLEAGTITQQQAEGRARHAVRLRYPELPTNSGGPPIEPIGEQLFQMGSIDPAVFGFLREQGLLTAAQETTIADGTMPDITQEQADRILGEFPNLQAFPAGGGPLQYVGSVVDPDPGSDGGATATTTTLAGAQGDTPFDQWVALLEAKGLLTDEQRAEAAAGRGFTLTPEQGAALQEYWDQQAADASTTAPAFTPSGDPATTGTAIDPCTSGTTAVPTATTDPDAATTDLTGPGGSVASTVTAPVTVTTTAVASEDGTWIVYLYVLSGRQDGDGTITPAVDVMQEIVAGSDPTEGALAQAARDAAAGQPVFEGDLACDVGAAEQLGLDPTLGQIAISVGFTDESDAEAFARSFDDASSELEPMGPVLIDQTCPARPAPS